MRSINNNIKYLPSSKEPLSADVYFIEGEKNCYIYDVGNDTNSLTSINRVGRGKTVILSHYHKDHTGNIEQIKCDALYVGRKTHEIIKKGEIVEENITINDGIKIEIIPCTSPHTDGSLIVNINNEYALIADLYFTRPPFDTEKAKLMVEHLKNIDTKYFVISHLEDEKIVPKEKMITELSEYFTH